jgi:hypothetical protein
MRLNESTKNRKLLCVLWRKLNSRQCRGNTSTTTAGIKDMAVSEAGITTVVINRDGCLGGHRRPIRPPDMSSWLGTILGGCPEAGVIEAPVVAVLAASGWGKAGNSSGKIWLHGQNN